MQASKSAAAPSLPASMLFLFGALLNQTSVIFGVNLSLADLLAVLLLFFAALHSYLYVPKYVTLFFLIITLVTVTVGVFITPMKLSFPVDPMSVTVDYVKLLTSFAYVVLGATLVRNQRFSLILRGFALVAVVIGFVAVVDMAVPGILPIEPMYYAGVRFRGLLNDPNYFAVLQIAAVAIIWRDKPLRPMVRFASFGIIAVSVLASGSKTGLIVMLALIAWHLFLFIFGGKNSTRSIARVMIFGFLFAILATLIAFVGSKTLMLGLAARMETNPALARLAPLLTDFATGIDADGSGRGGAWEGALALINNSPFFGVGVGTYLDAGESLTGEQVLAHNTFLQLAAEWGLPLAVFFFILVLIFLIKRPAQDASRLWETNRDVLLVLLVGSVGISLNNARLFWLVLGAVVAAYFYQDDTAESRVESA